MHTIRMIPELGAIRLITELYRDPERKSILRILFELCCLLVIHRTMPSHYFSRYLFKQDISNVTDYLPGKFLYKMKAKFNERSARNMLDNKLFFDLYYRQLNFNLPELWLHNSRRAFVLDGKCIEIQTVDGFKKLVEQVIRTNSVDNTVFIKKAYDTYGGASIYKMHLDHLSSFPDKINDIYLEIINSAFIFQQAIKQHHEMDRLNPFCLNTMRLDTFINPDGTVEIISGYLKTNIRNNHVDNEPTGGCEISLDLETGRLRKYGHLTLKFNGLSRPTQHPTTMTVFENFMVPHFNEAKEMVIRAARVMPALRLVGWDVAIGENGPVLIEGNSDYDIAASDLSYGGYRANPVFKKVLKEI